MSLMCTPITQCSLETVFIVLFKIYSVEYIYTVSFMAICNSPGVKDGMNVSKDISFYIFRFIYYFYNIEYLCIFRITRLNIVTGCQSSPVKSQSTMQFTIL